MPELNEDRGLARAVLRRYRVLDPAERRQGRLLVALALATMVLEWLGGAAVFAVVTLLAPGPHASALVPAALQPGSRVTQLAAVVAMGLFHVSRVGGLLALARVRERVRGAIGISLSGRLVDVHLRARLSQHVQGTSPERIRDVTEYAPAVWWVLDSSVYLATEVCVVVGLLGMMVLVQPRDVLLMGGILGLVVMPALQFSRRAVARHARQSRVVESRTLRSLQQLYGAWREVKVFGRERFFRDGFVHGRTEALGLNVHGATMGQLPRAVLETAFVLGACLLALLPATGSEGPAAAFPVLGLYAYSGFRAMPAVERILSYLAAIHRDVALTAPLIAELETAEGEVPDDGSLTSALVDRVVVDRVSFVHPGSDAAVLHEVALEIPRGTSLAIVGRTGAGKSTLLDLLLGLVAPVAGRVLVDGTVLGPENVRGWRSRIGYVPQSAFLLDETVRHNVALGVHDAEIDERRVWRALELAQARGFVAALPGGLDERVGEGGARLSGGERQRLAIARALYREPDVLLLDEAMAALDPATERELVAALAQVAGRTLVLVTHRMATAERCDVIAVLAAGRVVAIGSWGQLLATSAEFRELAADAEREDAIAPLAVTTPA